MQPYESSNDRSRYPAPGHVPAMRHPHGLSGVSAAAAAPARPQAYPRSATPIYDALYAEYERLFRALPGDRSGEEELRFERFDSGRALSDGAWSHTPRRHARAALPPAPRDGHRYGL